MADKRSDVCLLHVVRLDEMLLRTTDLSMATRVPDMLAAVLKAQPDWNALPTNVLLVASVVLGQGGCLCKATTGSVSPCISIPRSPARLQAVALHRTSTVVYIHSGRRGSGETPCSWPPAHEPALGLQPPRPGSQPASAVAVTGFAFTLPCRQHRSHR